MCCPTPDCPYIYELPNVGNKGAWNPKFECPICDAVYCLKCKKDFHFGKVCQGVINPGEMGDQRKKCPRCKFFVKRVNNNKILYCRCGKQFCFFCGLEKCCCEGYGAWEVVENKKIPQNQPGKDGFGSLEKMKNDY